MAGSARWWWVGAGVLVVGASIGVWRLRAGQSKGPQFVTAAVERGSVIGRVTATGTVSALVTVQVGAQVSGRIQALNADFNTPVKKGQLLAKLDPQLFEAALAQARANEQAAEGNLLKAKAQAADSERKLARAQELASQKLIAPADLDAAQADAEVARAGIQASQGSLAQARAQRKQAEVNLTYTEIHSPIDGTVISRAIDVGQTVAASLQSPTLFTIAENLTKMQVDTNIAEADVGKLKEGLDATFTVDAFAHRRFQGKIRQIRFAPQVVQNVVTYDAVIDVDNSEMLLRPGMTANVSFVYARVDDVLRVPNAALRFRLDSEGQRRPRGENPVGRTVYLMRDGGPQPVQVRAGTTDGSFTEVSGDDVKQGDQVVVDRQGESPARSPGGAPPGGMRRFF